MFGDDVAALVGEVTDDKSLPKLERKRLQAKHAPHKSGRAKILKLADKISNVRALAASPPADWTLERRREYVSWARDVVPALATHALTSNSSSSWLPGRPIACSKAQPEAAGGGPARLTSPSSVIPEMPEALSGIGANAGGCLSPDRAQAPFRDNGYGTIQRIWPRIRWLSGSLLEAGASGAGARTWLWSWHSAVSPLLEP